MDPAGLDPEHVFGISSVIRFAQIMPGVCSGPRMALDAADALRPRPLGASAGLNCFEACPVHPRWAFLGSGNMEQ